MLVGKSLGSFNTYCMLCTSSSHEACEDTTKDGETLRTKHVIDLFSICCVVCVCGAQSKIKNLRLAERAYVS